MFTGIIEEVGTVISVKRGTKSSVLTIRAEKVLEDLKTGDSINTHGVCLTVTEFSGTDFRVDVMPETMDRTTLGGLSGGSRVNLERALRLGDRLGGHLVSGHIDGTGKITGKRKEDNATRFTVSAGSGLLKYIALKGSVAVDGISLTVTEVTDRSFGFSIIPFTAAETTILKRDVGDLVNIECDLVAKYLEKFVPGGGAKGISASFLEEQGFI